MRPVSNCLGSHEVPRFKDVPKIDLILLDRKDLEHVGAGETPINALAPRMAKVISDSTGRRIRSMPLFHE